MTKVLWPSVEEPEVITFSDLHSVTARELSPAEAAELNRSIRLTMEQDAVEGKLLWYEICWRDHAEGSSGATTSFRPVASPITSEDLAALTASESFAPGTEFELYCYTGENAKRLIEENDMYDALFDPASGTTSFQIPIDPSLVEVPAHRLASFLTFGLKSSTQPDSSLSFWAPFCDTKKVRSERFY